MRVSKFNTSKYGKELLMDLGWMEEIPLFFGEGEPHAVDFYEVLFLRKANGTLQLDNQRIELKDGMILYISPYQRKFWEVKAQEMKGYFLIFARNFLELLFADPLFIFRLQYFHNHQTPLFIEEGEENQQQHNHTFNRILTELQHLQDDSEDIIRANLLLILAEHNRKYCQQYGLTPERSPSQDAYRFKKLLEENIRSLKKVDDFAEKLNISRITLNKRVKAKFGLTASELIKSRLLTEIQRDLMFTNKTISEISHDLDFSEPHHLIRFFKRLMNQTPIEFRLAYQNGYS